MIAIEASNVSKIYRRYGRQRQFATLKSALLSRSLVRDLKPAETLSALRDVSFSVKSGSTFGVIGRNGSGKSTLLKLVAGITKPTHGHMKVQGRISALIELGAGFHPEISGRENVFINGIMLGLSKKEITKRFDEIVEFAELEDFIDAPVKTYSSGMYIRLGFAVAIHVDPDVLLVDEVLAVGDESFSHKCLDKFAEFRRKGKTILFVTHGLGLVERFCDNAIWLDGGTVQAAGDPKRVIGAYLSDVKLQEEALLKANDTKVQANTKIVTTPTLVESSTEDSMAIATEVPEGRWGSREVEITDVSLVGKSGSPGHLFQSGESMEIQIRIKAIKRVSDFAFGVGFFNVDGVCCYGTNTTIEKFQASEFSGEGVVTFKIENLDLVEGTYKLDVAVHSEKGMPYDYHRLLYTFRIKSNLKDVGIYRPVHRWEFSPAIHFETKTKTETE
jgi:ABC-type polysaccharide/polyol phosphate transport system ATPase subunit